MKKRKRHPFAPSRQELRVIQAEQGWSGVMQIVGAAVKLGLISITVIGAAMSIHW